VTGPLPAVLDEFMARFRSSWERQDLDGLASLWDGDHPLATYVAEEVPEALVGLDAIREYWQSVFARFREIEVTLRPLAHDVWEGHAWLVGSGGFSGLRLADGARVVTSGVRVAVLLRQTRGVWKVAHYVEAPVRDA